ncbi:hypothetical protein D3C76_1609090 [compost metagenome]
MNNQNDKQNCSEQNIGSKPLVPEADRQTAQPSRADRACDRREFGDGDYGDGHAPDEGGQRLRDQYPADNGERAGADRFGRLNLSVLHLAQRVLDNAAEKRRCADRQGDNRRRRAERCAYNQP